MKRGIAAAIVFILLLFFAPSRAGALTPQQMAAQAAAQQQQYVQQILAKQRQMAQQESAQAQLMMMQQTQKFQAGAHDAFVNEINKGQVQTLDQKWVDLTMQINDLMRDSQIKAQAETPDTKDAADAVAGAVAAREAVRQSALVQVRKSDAYKNLLEARAADQKELDKLESSGGSPSPEAIQMADKVWADQTSISKIEQSALSVSPEWKAANDAVQAANAKLAAARAAQAKNPSDEVQQIQSQIRDLVAQRQTVDAQVQELIKKIAAVDANASATLSHERTGLLEEAQRMKDPVYAANVQKEKQEAADWWVQNPPHELTPAEAMQQQEDDYNRMRKEEADQREAAQHERDLQDQADRAKQQEEERERQQKEFDAQQAKAQEDAQHQRDEYDRMQREQAERDREYQRQQEERDRANQQMMQQ